MRTRRSGALWVGIGAVLALAALIAPASAYVTNSGYAVANYATGFASNTTKDRGSAGPIGLAFDLQNNLYVGDVVNGTMYKFTPGGGVANASTQFAQYSPGLAGIAFSVDDRMYIANQNSNEIDEVSKATGAVIRVVTTKVKCPTSLAIDPVSGDLFASQGLCAGPVERIEHPTAASPTVVDYTSGTNDVDGIEFAPDASLFLVDGVGNQIKVRQFAGTSATNPGALLAVYATVPNGDGIAFSLPVNGQPPHYLFVNRRDGIMTRIDMTTRPVRLLNIVTKGTRGDFVTVDSHNCVYPTQTSTVTRITHNGICDWFPTHVQPVVAATASTPSAPPAGAPTAGGTTTPNPPTRPSGGSSNEGGPLALTGLNQTLALIGGCLILIGGLLIGSRRRARR